MIWGRIGAAAIGLEITVGIVKVEAVFGDVGGADMLIVQSRALTPANIPVQVEHVA